MGNLLRIWITVAFALVGIGIGQTNFCSTAGGTRGGNLFALDGSFGTAPASTQTPTLTSSSNPTPTIQPSRYSFSTVPGITGGVDSSGRPLGTTTYTYNTRTAVNFPSNYSPEDGEYEITNSSYNRQDGAWFRFVGGRNGGGPTDLFMLINAAYAAGVFYQQALTVTPNTNYEFSVSAMNVIANGASILPNIQLEIDRAGVDDNNNGTIDEANEAQTVSLTGNIPNTTTATWKEYGAVINSGASTSITVRLRNNAPGGGGNDLAIDNLQFTNCNGLPTGNISGTLYYDANSNGTRDTAAPVDPALGSNIPVELVNPVTGAIVGTSLTNASGAYTFTNIPAGTYTIRVPLTASQLNGATPQTPSGAQRTNVILTSGASLTAQDFGFLEPVLTATKSVNVTSSSPGSTLTYTIAVSNTGKTNATASKLLDTLPSGVSYVANTATLNGTNLNAATYPFGSAYTINSTTGASGVIKVGETATVTFSVLLNNTAPLPSSPLTNQATVTYVGGPPGTVNSNTTSTPVNFPDLNLTKSHTGNFTRGSTGTYTFTVSNVGSVTSSGTLTVVDTLPTGLTYASNTGGWACSVTVAGPPQTITCTRSLALGAGANTSFNMVVNVGESTASSITNSATVSGGGQTNTSNDSASDGTTIVSTADLSVSKTDGSSTAVLGGTVTYTIVVSNAGPSAANGATVTDTLPSSLTGASWSCTASSGSSCGAASGTGNISTTVNLLSGGSATYTLSATVSQTATGNLVNTVSVSAPGGVTDSNSGNNSATDTDTFISQADLSITKTDGVTSEVPGTTVTYTIVAQNNGPSNVSGATVTDTLPSSLSGASWSCTASSGSSCGAASGTGNISTTVNLLSGGSATYTLSATVSGSATGSLVNTASIAVPSGITETNSGNNSATDTDTLTPQADLASTKTNGSTSSIPGTNTTYTLVVSNNGPSNVTGATVTDTMSTKYSSFAWTCTASSGSSCGVASGTGSINTTVNLLSGGTATYTVVAAIKSSSSGTLPNTATVAVPSGVTDSNSGNNSATDTDNLTSQTDLAITKTDGVTSEVPGTTVTYTIVATNNGPADVIGATVTDTLPSSLSGGSWSCTASSGSSCGAASGTGSINTTVNLLSGGSATYTLSATVSGSATGSLVNTASIAVPSGITETNSGNNSATDTDTLTPQADLAITKTNGLSGVSTGATTTYTLRVTNNGPSTVTGAILSDPAATGISKTSVACSSTPGQCTTAPTVSALEGGAFALPTLTSGQFYEITLTASITATSGSVTNTATVAVPSGTTDPTPSNNSASDTDTVNPVADLAISKTATAGVKPSDPIAYTVVVWNNGPSIATGVSLTDTLPSNLTGVSWTCVASGTADCDTTLGGTGASGSGNISLSNLSLNVDSGSTTTADTNYLTFSITATAPASVPASNPISNTASVAVPASISDPSSGNNSATASTYVYALSSLAGSLIINEVLYKQTGSSAATNDEFIELYNTGSSTVNLSTLKLLDGNLVTGDTDGIGSITGSAAPYTFAATTCSGSYPCSSGSTSLAPGQYAVIWIGNQDTTRAASGATFQAWLGQAPKLNDTGDDAWLYDSSNAIVDYMAYGSASGGGINTAPPSSLGLWGSSNAPSNATNGQSISLTPNGTNPNDGRCWEITTATGADTAASRGCPITSYATRDTDANVISGTQRITSAGEFNNYSELSISKTDGNTTLVSGSAIDYTITITNSAWGAINGATVTDTAPAAITGAAWTCVASSGSSCAAASGSGNINTTVNLAFGGSVTFHLTGTVAISYSGALSNTARITLPTRLTRSSSPTGYAEASDTTTVTLAGVTVSGSVYADLQPNTVKEPSENWSSGSTVFVNLVQGGSVVQSATVSSGAGTFSFSTVVAGNYSLVVTSTATATAPVAPTGWIFIDPNPGVLSLTVATVNLSNQDFGLFNGSKVSGTVFRDDGLSSGTANDALQNGGEAGIPNITVTASDGSQNLTAVTDTSGAFDFYIPASFGSTLTLSHIQNPATGTNISGASVVLASAYNSTAARSRSIGGFSAGQSYSGYNFGVVYPSSLRIDQSGQTTSPGVIGFTHRYRPGTLGTVSLSMGSGSLSYLVRRDANCNNAFDTGETYQAIPLSFTVDSTWPRDATGQLAECNIELLVSVPAGKPNGTVDIAQLQTALTWSNIPAIQDPRSVIDTTTVALPGNLRLDKQVRNITQGTAFSTASQGKPGDVLEYCIAYTDIGAQPISGVVMTDPIPFFTQYQSGSLVWNSTALTDATDSDAGELVSSTFIQVRIGNLSAGQSGQVCYRVSVR